jgi:hypothetical protein
MSAPLANLAAGVLSFMQWVLTDHIFHHVDPLTDQCPLLNARSRSAESMMSLSSETS